MKFNIMGIIFMMIAIALGTMLGAWIGGMVGLAGGLIGVFVVGFGVYVVYALLSGDKLNIMIGVIFAGLVWVSGLISGMVSGATGLGGGLIGLAIQAVVLGFLAGYVLKGKSPIGVTPQKSTGKKRRRKR